MREKKCDLIKSSPQDVENLNERQFIVPTCALNTRCIRPAHRLSAQRRTALFLLFMLLLF